MVLTASAGLVLGIGLGFRTDLLIGIPFFILTLFIFTPYGITKKLMNKLIGISIFLILFLLTSYPITKQYLSGGNIAHVIMLGQTKPFDKFLGIKSPLYDFGHIYNDNLPYYIFNSYAQNCYPEKYPLYMLSKNYEFIGKRYFFKLFENFPADFLTRIYGASWCILALPSVPNSLTFSVRQNMVQKLKYKLIYFIYIFYILSVPVFFISLCIIWLSSKRQFYFWLTLVMYFSAFAFMQFQGRHVFYFEFISLLFWGYCSLFFFNQIQKTITMYKNTASMEMKGLLITTFNQVLNKNLLLPIIIIGSLFFALFSLRIYQQYHLYSFFSKYIEAKKVQVPVKENLVDEKFLLLEPVVIEKEKNDKSNRANISDYVAVEFENSAKYGNLTFSVDIQYDYNNEPFNDLSKKFTVSLNSQTGYLAWIFTPVYFMHVPNENVSFKGIKIPQRAREYVKGVYCLEDKKKFPLFLNIYLPENWRNYSLYQTLRFEKRKEDKLIH